MDIILFLKNGSFALVYLDDIVTFLSPQTSTSIMCETSRRYWTTLGNTKVKEICVLQDLYKLPWQGHKPGHLDVHLDTICPINS